MSPPRENDILNGLLSHFLVKNKTAVCDGEGGQKDTQKHSGTTRASKAHQSELQAETNGCKFPPDLPQKHVGDCKQVEEGPPGQKMEHVTIGPDNLSYLWWQFLLTLSQQMQPVPVNAAID